MVVWTLKIRYPNMHKPCSKFTWQINQEERSHTLKISRAKSKIAIIKQKSQAIQIIHIMSYICLLSHLQIIYWNVFYHTYYDNVTNFSESLAKRSILVIHLIYEVVFIIILHIFRKDTTICTYLCVTFNCLQPSWWGQRILEQVFIC